ncbi:hypothetical protein [[Scytonema hofmanni] UTEX B 1581]|uniref:hypothetical protein n=1 Tax=[Scytonema hofmanni] UTEX B 1581 TaxID=379535 RepID=UPI0004ACE165|nr:hypothetical protein [[Scytonema hofmanni] UTEX B 1581]
MRSHCLPKTRLIKLWRPQIANLHFPTWKQIGNRENIPIRKYHRFLSRIVNLNNPLIWVDENSYPSSLEARSHQSLQQFSCI